MDTIGSGMELLREQDFSSRLTLVGQYEADRCLLYTSFSQILTAQNEREITLNEAIALARTQSVDAAVALNELKTAYWEYRTFRADLLPEVNLTCLLYTSRCV